MRECKRWNIRMCERVLCVVCVREREREGGRERERERERGERETYVDVCVSSPSMRMFIGCNFKSGTLSPCDDY